MAYNPTVNTGRTARTFSPVTPADTDLPGGECSALYVGTGGDVSCLDSLSATVVFKNVPSGSVLPVRTVQVKAATTATDIVALY